MAYFDRIKSVERAHGATYMTFDLSGQVYGIPLDIVTEVAAAENITPIVSEDPAVVGEMDLRGSALIVVDMGIRLMGTPVARTNKNCVLIVRRRGARSGCLVESEDGLISIPKDEIELSGCLVESADTRSIDETLVITPENTSQSGVEHGFPLFRSKDGVILLPNAEKCFPL